jgi:FlaA1/EpsC-like NDP-sugar epimerase
MITQSNTATGIVRALAGVIERTVALSRPIKRIIVMVGDAALCVVAVWLAYYLRLGEWRLFTDDVAKLTIGAELFWFAGASLNGVYREVFRYAGIGTMIALGRATLTMLIPMIGVFLVLLVPGVPRTLSVLQPLVFFLLVAFSRLLVRYVVMDLRPSVSFEGHRRRILIYGAGDAGQRLAASIRHQPGLELVGFVDDDFRKVGHRLDQVRISPASELPEVIERKRATDVYIAMPRLSRTARSRVIDGLAKHPVQVMTLPDMREIIEGDVTVDDLRAIDIADLLGRAAVAPDAALLASTITGKVVMVTGAGGSIGSELCNQIARLGPARLVLVEISEFALYTVDAAIRRLMAEQVAPFPVIAELCDVADHAAISRLMARQRPHTVFHAAAYKHVPLVEANVIAGARNNVMGTYNTALAARANGVRRFILISTDKAVRPTNVMGATKRICEQILQAYAAEPAARDTTTFAMVRFGNVLGSSGSVVPLFKRQIRAGGPITLTDARITRYFMSIPEAAELVIQAGAMAAGGEVYVLDMGTSIRILDLARTMIQLSGLRVRDTDNPDGDIAIVEVGLRPGEKLYEELLIGDNPETTSHPRIMRARERFLPLAELQTALAEFSHLLDNGDDAGVRAMIARLVPEYAPSSDLEAAA